MKDLLGILFNFFSFVFVFFFNFFILFPYHPQMFSLWQEKYESRGKLFDQEFQKLSSKKRCSTEKLKVKPD